jgi:energy-coupling factor transport system substrate-specific component
MLDNIKKEFSTRTLVLIPIAIVLNIVIGELVTRLKLPIYLDSIGTVLVGAIAGPWAGALTGALANLIWGLFNPVPAYFFYVAAVIGMMAGLAGKSGAFQNISPRWLSAIIGAVFFFSLTVFILAFVNSTTTEAGFAFPSMADLFANYSVVFVLALLVGGAIGYFLMQGAGYAGLWGLATGVVAAILSAPMAAYYFGGVTGSGMDLLVAAFRASGANIVASVMAQGVVSDPFDKMLSFMIVWLILRSMPARLKAR